MPGRKTLEDAYSRAARLIPIQRLLKEPEGPKVRVPRDLEAQIKKFLKQHPAASWDEALYRIAKRDLP